MNYIDFFSSMQELYQRALAPVCREYGLSSMELTILLFLANNPDYDTAAQIVRKRHLSKSHVSISIYSLEQKGLLRKEQRDGNRRSEHLVLCTSSKAMVKAGLEAQRRFLDKLTDGITQEQKNEMEHTLQIMGSNVAKAPEEGAK